MDNRPAVCHPSVIDAADHIASFQIDPAVKGSAFYGSAVIDHSAVKYAAENEAFIRHLGADTDSVRRGKGAGFSDDKLPDKSAAVHKQLTGRHLDIPDGSPCVAVGYGQRAGVCIKFRFVRSAHAADGVSVQADLHPVGHRMIGVGFQKHIARQIVVSCRGRERIRLCPRCPHERIMHRMSLRCNFSAADAVRVDLTFDHDLARIGAECAEIVAGPICGVLAVLVGGGDLRKAAYDSEGGTAHHDILGLKLHQTVFESRFCMLVAGECVLITFCLEYAVFNGKSRVSAV